jgi:hypothetical protein
MSRAVSGSHVGTATPAIDPSSGVRARKFDIATLLFTTSYPVRAFNSFGITIQYYIRVTSAGPSITYRKRRGFRGPEPGRREHGLPPVRRTINRRTKPCCHRSTNRPLCGPCCDRPTGSQRGRDRERNPPRVSGPYRYRHDPPRDCRSGERPRRDVRRGCRLSAPTGVGSVPRYEAGNGRRRRSRCRHRRRRSAVHSESNQYQATRS